MARRFSLTADELAEFNAFDGELNDFDSEVDDFDEDYMDTPAPKAKALDNINIQIISTAYADVQIELFNFLNSFVKLLNRGIITPSMAANGVDLIPFESWEGRQRLAKGVASAHVDNAALTVLSPDVFIPGMVYFDQTGQLIITSANADAAGAGSGKVTVQLTGNNMNYRKLFEHSYRKQLQIKGFRFVYNRADQIDQDLQTFRLTPTGGQKGNSISPRAFFKPEQQQSLIVDVPIPATVQPDSGFIYNVLGNGGVIVTPNIINVSVFLTT